MLLTCCFALQNSKNHPFPQRTFFVPFSHSWFLFFANCQILTPVKNNLRIKYHELIFKLKDQGVKHLPIALYPSPLPRNLFDKIFFYQIAFNKIINKLSNDQPYLEKILETIASKNNFFQKLLEISKKSVKNFLFPMSLFPLTAAR